MNNINYQSFTNVIFGRLKVLKESSYRLDRKYRYFWCECSCNSNFTKLVKLDNLKQSITRSCGCLSKENRIKLAKNMQNHNTKYHSIQEKKEASRSQARVRYNSNPKKYIEISKAKSIKYRSKILNRLKERNKNDLNFRLKQRIRNRIVKILKLNNYRKKDETLNYLGCSVNQYKDYLQSKFELNMTWDNYGRTVDSWNIDHIIPLSKFDLSKDEEKYKAFNYTNTQPMWASLNSSKGNRYVG